ncbi:helix-turn-helix domain-containing protein [Flagellimonas meishanensis]|uniref:helix-turn-helix domain-containing protein n=1 Tax=Flagellimonas meishanensis TaxID=2873264 RepID=UPI001CA7B180|nr:helix-turn-helix domain-containing protein [[Muricauda] meishanensis]
MQLNISIIQLITICAVANGFVFGLLLLEKRENRFANRFLSMSILCLCLTFTPYMLDPSIWHKYRWLAWMPFSVSYWIGPSFYFYVRTLTRPQERFKKIHLWHFSPILLNYLHSIFHAIFPGSKTPWHYFHFVAEILESAAVISILVYMVLSLKMIVRYQKMLLDHVSNTDSLDLGWIKNCIKIIMASFVMILIFLAISTGISGKELFGQWDTYRSVVLLGYACFLYWLSIHGYRQAQTLQIKKADGLEAKISNDESVTIITKLDMGMRGQKLFRDPELSLSSLSKMMGIPERNISEAINGGLGKNFYQFVNEYRIGDVQEKLKDPLNHNLKIISLAYDSGFNSKATFNRIFKLYTGLTPREYKTQKRAENSLFET